MQRYISSIGLFAYLFTTFAFRTIGAFVPVIAASLCKVHSHFYTLYSAPLAQNLLRVPLPATWYSQHT